MPPPRGLPTWGDDRIGHAVFGQPPSGDGSYVIHRLESGGYHQPPPGDGSYRAAVATWRAVDRERRARDSNPQPLTGHIISNDAASHSLTLQNPCLYRSRWLRAHGFRYVKVYPRRLEPQANLTHDSKGFRLMPTSQAWFYRQNQTAYDLELGPQSVSDPQGLGDHDILVAIEGVSLNYRDLVAWKNMAGRAVEGRVPASDGAGTVLAVGSAVTQWRQGDRVAGCFFPRWQSGRFDLSNHRFDLGGSLDGMLRRHVVMHEDAWVRVPAHLDTLAASTLPCAALTAWYSLVVRGGLTHGQTVLVLGTGGVSIFALQMAKSLGARVIITSSSDAKLERARALGAEEGVNYRTHPPWSEQVWSWTGGRGVDLVVEVGGPGTLDQSMKSVAGGGHIALIGVLTGFGATTASLFPLLARNVTLNGVYVGPRDAFVQMNRFLEENRIEPVIDRVFPFEAAPDAFAYLASGQHFGKVVIQLA